MRKKNQETRQNLQLMLEGVNGVMALTAYGLSFGQFTANN